MAFWNRSSPGLGPEHVRVDVHNHLLPGVDDGLANLEEASACIETMTKMGYRGAVLTPHIYRDVFNTEESFLQSMFEQFAADLRKPFPDFKVQLAAEYMIDDVFIDRLYGEPRTLLRFGPDNSRLLVEFPVTTEPLFCDEILDECQRQRLRPVIAHVERYMFIQGDRSNTRLTEWRKRGALIQLNLGSLVGQYGPSIQNAARRLWNDDMIDLLATDLHTPRRGLTLVQKGWKYVAGRPGNFQAKHHIDIFEAMP